MIGRFSGNNATCSIPSTGTGLNSSSMAGSTGLNFSLPTGDGKNSGISNNSYAIGINGASGGMNSFNKSKSFHKSNSGIAKKVHIYPNN